MGYFVGRTKRVREQAPQPPIDDGLHSSHVKREVLVEKKKNIVVSHIRDTVNETIPMDGRDWSL